MGTSTAPLNCYINDLTTKNLISDSDSVDYLVEFNGINIFFKFVWDIDSHLSELSENEMLILKRI